MKENVDNLGLEWAAGFLEGEGSFFYGNTPTVSASQKQKWPLEKLHEIFNSGSLTGPYGSKKMYKFTACGENALHILNLIYPYMSPRRQKQIQNAINNVQSTYNVSNKNKCRNNLHDLLADTDFYFYKDGRKTCNQCRLLWEEKHGAERKRKWLQKRTEQYERER